MSPSEDADDVSAPGYPTIAIRVRGLYDDESDLQIAMVCTVCGAVLREHSYDRHQALDEQFTLADSHSETDRALAERHIREECSPPPRGKQDERSNGRRETTTEASRRSDRSDADAM